MLIICLVGTLLFTETLISHLLCLWQYERNKPQNQDTLRKLWNICTALTAQSAHKQQKYKINLSVYNAWDILIWISCHDWQGTYAWGTKLEFSSMAVNLGRKVAQLPTKPWLKRFMVSIILIGLQDSFNVYTGCPTNMLTSSDPILKFSNPHVSKSKTDFEKFR